MDLLALGTGIAAAAVIWAFAFRLRFDTYAVVVRHLEERLGR
jgi:hypothetical protein